MSRTQKNGRSDLRSDHRKYPPCRTDLPIRSPIIFMSFWTKFPIDRPRFVVFYGSQLAMPHIQTSPARFVFEKLPDVSKSRENGFRLQKCCPCRAEAFDTYRLKVMKLLVYYTINLLDILYSRLFEYKGSRTLLK